MSGASCITRKDRTAFAKRVVENLSKEQKKDFGITKENQDVATKVISSIAGVIYHEFDENERAKKMSNTDDFVERFTNEYLEIALPKDKLDEATESYADFIKKYGSRYVEIDLSIYNDKGIEQELKNLKRFGNLVFIREDPDKQFIRAFIKEPVREEPTTPQEVTLDNIERLQEKEYLQEYKLNNTLYWVNVSKGERSRKGSKATGRYKYNGQIIETKTVIYDVYGDKPYTGPVLAGPIGDYVDAVGRLFFNKKSSIWNKDGTLKSDEELKEVLELSGDLGKHRTVCTLAGLKNLLNDFAELEKELNEKWPGFKAFSGDLRMFAKKSDGSWITGSPDLLIVDSKGVIHVLDFKTKVLSSTEGYINVLQDETGSNYSKQVSRYIRMLQSYGFKVDEDPYVVLADTWYQKSDRGENSEAEGDKIYNVDKYNPDFAKRGVFFNKNNDEDLVDQPLNKYLEENRVEKVTDAFQDGSILYIEPRLHVKATKSDGKFMPSDELAALRGKDEGISFDDTLDPYERQFVFASKEERERAEYYGMNKKKSINRNYGINKISQKDISGNPELISDGEIQTVADSIMYAVSDLINFLARGEQYDSIPLSKTGKLKGKSHEYIIKKVKIENLIEEVFKQKIRDRYDEEFPMVAINDFGEDGWIDEDEYYHYDTYDEYEKDKRMNDKAKWLIDHYDQFVLKGYPKLLALEKSLVPIKRQEDETTGKTSPNVGTSIDPNYVKKDSGDNNEIESLIEKLNEGITDAEAWMMNQRNYSVKASLAQEMRRLFEDLYLLDENGNKVYDPYGWNLLQHIDSTKAMQAVLDTCKNCETFEEMETALRKFARNPVNGWANDVLDRISDDDNLKKKFFINFRKDALNYSLCQVKYDRNTGTRIIETKIINTKSATQSMLDSLSSTFSDGNVGIFNGNYLIEGHKLNKKTLKELRQKIGSKDQRGNSLAASVADVYRRRGSRKEGELADFIKEEFQKERSDGSTILDDYLNVLNGIGVKVTKGIILDYILKYTARSYAKGNAGALITNIIEVLNQLEQQDKEGGIPHGLAGNHSYGYYYRIISDLSDFVQDHIEASLYLDGKTYYAYTNPSRLGHIIRNLTDALGTHEGFIGEESKFIKYLEENFGRYTGWFKTVPDEDGESVWLNDLIRQLATSEDARKALKHKVELSYIGNQYKNLGSLGFTLSLLHNYFGSKDDNAVNANYRWFGLPTMSNKPTNEFIRMLKYGSDNLDKNGEPVYKSEIIDKVLMNTFQQECNRIADVLFHYNNNPETSATDEIDLTNKKLKSAGFSEAEIAELQEKIRNADLQPEDIVKLFKTSSGAKFHFLWYLNSEMEDSLNGKSNSNLILQLTDKINGLLIPKDKSELELKRKTLLNPAKEDALTQTVRKAIKDNMEKVVEAELKEFDAIGLFDYERKAQPIKGKGKSVVQIDSYTVRVGNEIVKANGEIIEVREDKIIYKSLKYQSEFNGNLGTNNDKNAMKKAVTEYIWQDIAANINIIQITGGDLAFYGNAINYQKRIAQIHSPGLHLMHDERYDDGYLRSVHISDKKAVSEILQNALEALREYRDSIKDPNLRAEYDKMVKIIAKEFEDINVTDGQSYSCPTSKRKKLLLQGKWDDEMEKAYNKILKGDFNLNYLAVLLQPDKPFVTSDMAKYSGSPTMVLRRTPLQDKNSEYMIFLAEALSRGAGKRSNMSAIFEFMERSAHEDEDLSKPTHRHGIDTSHFKSVGKVGVSGVIDIEKFAKDFDERVKKGETKEENYHDELVEFLLKHTRRADSKKESFQDLKTLEKINKECVEKNLLKPEEVIYNQTYVDTIPVEDYIIQQEVPAHLLEHEQLYGSQIRILGISDITPGTEFKVRRLDENGNVSTQSISDKELIEEYKLLHSKNIEDSFNELMIELGLSEVVLEDGKATIKNVDLSDSKKRDKFYKNLAYILRKELLKDSKYGFDSIRACSLEYDGESVVDFNVPLMDPIQSKRIQMLINSIIKKTINKQKILGGPVVQTTVYDNDLHIRFQDKNGNLLMSLPEFIESKKQGNAIFTGETYESLVEEYKKWLKENQAGIAYFECYMPVPNEKLEKLIAKRDGSLMTPEEIQKAMPKVWESMSQVIGYRIPTEDKYSMIPLKIKGFLPKIAGQAIMMPKEITLLTGSDFDIDKMYIMMKAFETYDVDTSEKAMSDFWKEFLKSEGKKVHLNKDNKYYDKAKRVMFNASEILAGEVDVNLYDGVDRRNEEIDIFVNWYRKRLLGTSFKEYSDTENTNKIVARQSRNNRLLDIQWAVLTAKDTSSKMLNPGNFNEPKRVGRFVRILKSKAINEETGKPWTHKELNKKFNELLNGPYENPFKTAIDYFDNILENANHHNTTLPSSKIYFQRQNMQGTQMVGIIANNSVSHAFCTFQKIGIDLTKGGVNRSFAFNNVRIGEVNSIDEIAVLDRQRGFNGQLISKSIATDLNSVLDTAKDPVSADSNINTFTVNVAMTLIRLGYDIETVCYFLSQPILVKLAEHYFKNKTNGFYNGDTAIKEIATEIGLDKKILENPREAGIQDKSVLTFENFADHLGDDDFMTDNTDEGKKKMEYQKQILVAFNSLFTIANSVQELTFCTKFNSVSNAVGPTIADTMEAQSRVENFIGSSETNVFYTPSAAAIERGFTSAEEVITNDPILRAFYEHTYDKVTGASARIFKEFFPHYFEGFENVLKTFKERYCRNGKINSKLYNQLLDEYIYYLLTYLGEEVEKETGEITREFKPTIPSSKEDKDYLIKHVIEEFGEVLKIEGRKPNLILDQGLNGSCLKIRHKDEYLAMDTLVFNGGQMNAEVQEKIRVAWSDLMTSNDPDLSPEDNKKLRDFGIDLFFYTLMRNGFGFSPKTLMHLASVTVRLNARYADEFNPYIDGLRKLQELDTYLMPYESEQIDRFLDQFVRNHSNNRSLVPTIEGTDENLTYNEDKDGNVTSIEFVVEAGKEEKLYNIMINTKQKKPYTFINLLKKDGKRLYSELYKVDNIRGVFSDGTKTSVLYKKVNILGFVNNFIEYNANDDLDVSYFGDTRNESPEAFDDEEQNQEFGSTEQQEGDDVFNTEELTWNEFASALKELEGEQQESKPYRTALWNAVNETNNPTFKNLVRKAMDKTIDKLERQKAMDTINSDETIQKEVKPIREKMEDTKKKNNKCNS